MINLILGAYERLTAIFKANPILYVLAPVGSVLTFGLFALIGGVIITDSIQPQTTVGGIVSFTNQFGTSHTLNVEIADSVDERREGLMFRTFMPADQGMLFIFPDAEPRAFWMKNTQIPLDIIFLDSSGVVVSFHENAIPFQTSPTYPSVYPTQFVIEANGGWASSAELQVGDVFELRF